MTGKVAESVDPLPEMEKVNGSTEAGPVPERKWKEIKIPVPWGQISGKWWGPAMPQPVLALHGWQDNAGTWDTLIPLLPHDIPILALDMPGHGLSSHYPKGQFYYFSWDGPQVLRRLVKHFGWKSLTILGHSMGGIIGFMYAAMFPEDVKKLIQIDIVAPTVRAPGTLCKMANEIIDRFLKYEDLTESDMPCYDYQDMLDTVVDAYNGSVDRERCKIILKRGIIRSPNGDGYLFSRDPRLKIAGLGHPAYSQTMEMADNIRCDVLNIRALPYNSFDKPEHYNEVLDRIRKNAKVEYHEVHGTHHLHLNTPERVSDLISMFLRS